MTNKEALLVAIEALHYCEALNRDVDERKMQAITVIRKLWTEHAMQEVQRLGQEIEQEPEFFTHSVERPYDWSEWVCPDPKGYMMKCCDCGLVHEAEFSVVRYKSETEREYCDRVDDPNLQAVFRMRRSEQWSPEDTAHRTGGLPMAQRTEQEPVIDKSAAIRIATALGWEPKREWVGLTDEEIEIIYAECNVWDKFEYERMLEAKLKEKNT